MNISTLKQVKNENFCFSCIVNWVYILNYFDFQLRCVRLEMPNPLFDSHT